MAEDFNDWGSYRKMQEDEEFAGRSVIRKIFSFRALKFAVKGFGYLLLISIFVILFWRIFSSRLPKDASNILWTEDSYAAYETLGNDLLIYTQDVGKVFDKDGKFSLYELIYIPASKELQFTIRYNHSTVDTLAAELTQKAMDTLGDSFTDDDIVTSSELAAMPFAFKLRTGDGIVYDEYQYTTFTKNRYTYVRISFSGIDLFDVERNTPTVNLPVPEVSNPDYIYKGAFSAEYTKAPTEIVYVDTYYEPDFECGEAFATPIALYRSDRKTTVYDYRNDRPKSVTSGIVSFGKED